MHEDEHVPLAEFLPVIPHSFCLHENLAYEEMILLVRHFYKH